MEQSKQIFSSDSDCIGLELLSLTSFLMENMSFKPLSKRKQNYLLFVRILRLIYFVAVVCSFSLHGIMSSS